MTFEEMIQRAQDELAARDPRDYDTSYDAARDILEEYDLSDAEFDAAMDIILSNHDF